MRFSWSGMSLFSTRRSGGLRRNYQQHMAVNFKCDAKKSPGRGTGAGKNVEQMMVELHDTHVVNPLSAAVAAFRDRPDDLCRESFKHFQTLFRSSQAKAREMQEIQLISYLPANVYQDRGTLGAVITGAMMATFTHQAETRDVDARCLPAAIALGSAETMEEIKMCLACLPDDACHQLDEIILRQGVLTGSGLLASDIVLMRVLQWERHDLAKTERWLRALRKAARIQQRKQAAPLSDPFWNEVKERTLDQLRPIVARMRAWYKGKRENPTRAEIVEAFAKESSNPDLSILTESNRDLWMAFCCYNPQAFLRLSAENLFDEFVGYVTSHGSEYTRKKISSRK
jgi:hypothetical protein